MFETTYELTNLKMTIQLAARVELDQHINLQRYGKCPKNLYTKVFDKMAYANREDLDQTAAEGESDQGLDCLPVY